MRIYKELDAIGFFKWYCTQYGGLVYQEYKPVYDDLPLDNIIRTELNACVFKFFREKYNLDASMSVNVWGEKQTSYRITGGIKGVIEADSYGALYDIDTEYYNSYEVAELECIKKLIEIVKQK
jgi:hypothetical protein